MSTKVLVVDDEKLIRWSLEKELTKRGYSAITAGSLAEARTLFEQEAPEVVLLDIQLPDGVGSDFLKEIHDGGSEASVIVITANDDVQTAVYCMQQGAFSYLNKPFDFEETCINIEKAVEAGRMRRRINSWETSKKKKYDFSNMVAESPVMQPVLELIQQVSQAPFTTVLLQGESGTGKDMTARALHYGGSFASTPFLSINCAAIPLNLLESELFGHEKGAFTDARTAKKGLVEEASGGTLFLDEIGDMPKEMQAKLLHLIDQKRFRRLGGVKEQEVEIRIIAATNKDLKEEVAQKNFREDLYYRLNVIPLQLPPLRERREDIPLLTSFFIAHYNSEFRKHVMGMDDEAMDIFLNYGWPGNIRELKNTIERCMILNQSDTILREHLPTEIDCHCALRDECKPRQDGKEASDSIPRCLTGMPLESVEKQVILLTLKQVDGNQSRAAKILGIGRDALRYKLQKFGLAKAEKELQP